MTDRRFLAANENVAHDALMGTVNAPRYSEGETYRIGVPWTNLCITPNGPRDKQLLFGQAFCVLEIRNGWAFGFDAKDGYVGFVAENDLSKRPPPTHKVCTRLAHVYEYPDIKEPECALLSFQSELTLSDEVGDFFILRDFRYSEGDGYIPKQHVQRLDAVTGTTAAIAHMFLGTPYLWGGNTGTGIDCSGLVQLCMAAVRRACPRDSDLQHKHFDPIDPATRQRGDLVFWKGHVGMLLDADTLIHANAHHMMVAIEDLEGAITRIAQKEFGQVTGYARPVSSG